MGRFHQLLRASLKSEDTEEWLDIHFTRPVGLAFALLWERLGVHPNTVTLLSIVLGVGAAFMFYHTGLLYNVGGVVLLMLANFCDSTDGQLARLTGQKSFVGRILDGLSGGIWFLTIDTALCLRMQKELMPGTDCQWGLLIWALAIVAEILCHVPQSSLSDYYRQIHLYFLKGEGGSEFDHSAQLRARVKTLPKHGTLLQRLFYSNYASYCESQERRTPCFQRFFALYKERRNESIRQRFLNGSRPLMTYTNILTFNMRAIVLYATCLLDCPWVYFLFEITVMQCLYIYMHKTHESLCTTLATDLVRVQDTSDDKKN